MGISPLVDLSVKADNAWDQTYPNLRVKSMSIAVTDGYIQGEDTLSLPEVPGFSSEWDADQGILTVSAVPGYDFTENTADDYVADSVELVDVSEVLNTVEATARITQFQEALRLVKFESGSGGSISRQMTLSAQELLTADEIATISVARIINTPDPPEILPSPLPLIYTEKAPYTPVDASVQVSVEFPARHAELGCVCLPALISSLHCRFQAVHPDGDVKLQSGSIWMEPMAGNDQLVYQPSFNSDAVPSSVFVDYDPDTKRWTIDGLADVETYTSILQVSPATIFVRTSYFVAHCIYGGGLTSCCCLPA